MMPHEDPHGFLPYFSSRQNVLYTASMLIRKRLEKLIHNYRRAHQPGAGNRGMVVESGSVDISRLSAVKADESHLA